MFAEQPTNPFFNRQRITDPAYFFGREEEVEALYGAIITRQSRSIVGERKIGKSSLLTQLACPSTLKRHGLDPQKYIFLYVDLEGMANIGYTEFWPEIMDLLDIALPDEHEKLKSMAADLAMSEELRFTQVRRFLRRLDRSGLTLVMMLDEFESLARNEEFDASFYGELRSLAGEIGVVYLTISKLSLYDLTYQHEDTLSSPFFNIFSELRLNLLKEKDAHGLLHHLANLGKHQLGDDDVSLIHQLGGRHPFFLQIAASQLVSARQNSGGEDQIVRRFKAEAEDHYRYLWSQLTDDERIALRQQQSADGALLKQLQIKALLISGENDGLAPFSADFAQFLARQGTSALRPLTPPPSKSGTDQTRIQDRGTDELTGKTLGRYRVLTPIGRGGMATVYRGYQSSLDRYVAIKVMSQQLVSDQSFIDRFQREAASVAQIRHQNIVQMFDFGLHENLSYMVMEFIDGPSLKERLYNADTRTITPLDLTESLQAIRGIAHALDYAHAHGIVHRDVKPANIMLRPEIKLAQLTGSVPFSAVLTDFGVARMLEGVSLTQTGATVGTPDYMSPEQVSGKPTEAASDIYSLGIVLYEMVTGERPFRGDTPIAVLLQHIDADPPSVIERIPHLPHGLDRVINTAMAKDHAKRYPTAGAMADALSKIVQEAAQGSDS